VIRKKKKIIQIEKRDRSNNGKGIDVSSIRRFFFVEVLIFFPFW